MPNNINRRTALKSGTLAAAGIGNAMTSRQAEAFSLSQAWGEDFLTAWSPNPDSSRDLTPGDTPVRLSCSAWCLHYSPGMDIGKRVREIRAAGYTACEADDNWKQASDSDIRELNDALRTHDLWFYAIHRCINNIHPDRAERRKINRRVAENVELAERLGLSFIVSHTGSCDPRPTLPHCDNWTKETWDASVAAMKQIISDTSGSKVSLAIEALNPCNINNPKAHLRLKADVGSDRIKVTLDPQNMLNTATYYRTTELVNECFDLLGEDICYAHCKDVLWEPEMLPSFSWVVAGTGGMDFEQYLVRLSRMRSARPFFLEFLPTEKYPAAKQYIEQTAQKVGVTIYH